MRGILFLLGVAGALVPVAYASAEPPAAGRIEPSDPPRVYLHAGLGGGALLDAGPAITGRLNLEWRLLDWLAIDAVTSTGTETHDSGLLWVTLAAGARFRWPGLEDWQPYAALRLLHVHMAPRQTWGDHPLATIAGDEEYLDHRSGLGLGLGVSVPPDPDLPVLLSFEAEGRWVALGEGPSLLLTGWLTLGYGF